jgi:ABC-type Zn uptake system ZnuABC Zn-binding protein ZnuA
MRSLVLALFVVASMARGAHAELRVVTTTEDLASLVREVGGPRVRVQALLKGDVDSLAPRLSPGMVPPLERADLLVVIGSGLEDRWLPSLISRSRNAHLQPGVDGYWDVSAVVDLLEPAPGPPRVGERPDGNPHYWLDPANGRRIAKMIVRKLSSLEPGGASEFKGRYDDFDRRLAEGETRWAEALAPFKGRRLAAWDRTWSYFAARYGLELVAWVEARPGAAVSPDRIPVAVTEIQRAEGKLLLVEPCVDTKLASGIASQAGAHVVLLPASVGGVKAATGYCALFDEIVARLVAALR